MLLNLRWMGKAKDRVKGFASRGPGTEDGARRQRAEGREQRAESRERRSVVGGQWSEARDQRSHAWLWLFLLFGSDPAASLPNFFNNRCKVSRSFFERTRMAFPSLRRVRESRERSAPVPSRSVQPDAPAGLASAPCAQPILFSPADQPPR